MATDQERRQALESRIAIELASGGVLESQTAYNAGILHGKPVNHVLHAILSLVTVGFWLIVRLLLVVTHKQQRVVLTVTEDGSVNRTVTTG